MLATVLSVFTAVAAVVPAAAVEGTVSQHYDGEIKGRGQSIDTSSESAYRVILNLQSAVRLKNTEYSFMTQQGISMWTKAVIQESLPINSIFQPAHNMLPMLVPTTQRAVMSLTQQKLYSVILTMIIK